MIQINKENFEAEVLKAKMPVVVDFWAEWCGPCRMMGPVFEELSQELKNLKFAKVNVEEEQFLASNNNVRGIPLLIIFKNGKEIGRIIGYNPKEILMKKLNEIIGGGK